MNLQIFAVRDNKTDQYGNPMFLVTKGHAIRTFADEVNRTDATNLLNTHSEDFALFELGSYNTQTGELNTHVPTQVVLGSEVKASK